MTLQCNLLISVQWKLFIQHCKNKNECLLVSCFNIVQGLLPCAHIFSFQSYLHAAQCYKRVKKKNLKLRGTTNTNVHITVTANGTLSVIKAHRSIKLVGRIPEQMTKKKQW